MIELLNGSNFQTPIKIKQEINSEEIKIDTAPPKPINFRKENPVGYEKPKEKTSQKKGHVIRRNLDIDNKYEENTQDHSVGKSTYDMMYNES